MKKNKECETLWIKLSEKEEDTDCIVIGGIYSPCESSTTKNKISNFVSELDKDIKEIKENVTEKILMVGDMNAHVGCDDQGIKGNNQHVGVNGEEYRKLFKNNKMTLMNNTNVCKGKWTRIQGDSKSILDLTVATEALKDKITSMEIDEDGKLNIESKRAATDHKMTTLIIRDWVEKRKEKWRTLVTYDKNRWGEYSQDTDYNIRKLKRTEEMTYEKMVAVVRKTSNKIRKKRKVPANKQKKLFGYNEEIKKAIKERRIACQEWKKEKEPVRKEEKRKIYQRKRELAISLMERTEAKEIEKLIKRNGKEELNFWRTIKQIKKKTSTKEEAIEDENGEITKNPRTLMKIKSEYYENLYKKNLSAEETERENEYLKDLEEAFNDIWENLKSYNQKFTKEELMKCIMLLKMNKAHGPDGITYEMIKHGGEELHELILRIANQILFEEVETPEDWDFGDIISIYKGKGKKTQMKFQRGLTLTSCIMKVVEKMIGSRIGPLIKDNSTDLQGGGKKGEAVEEYLLAIQTIIDRNKQDGKETKLLITDVAKAFDQAWRIAVFRNLSSRGIRGRILKMIWKMNNNLIARIKGQDMISGEFEVEGSLRQGGGLSATLYGQHIAKVIEHLEDNEIGGYIGKTRVPAIGWQDDVTGITTTNRELNRMTKLIVEKADENKIYFSEDDKCKLLSINKKKYGKEEEEAVLKLGTIPLKKVAEAKVLGYTFNEEGNNTAHIDGKQQQTTSMIANMGLSIKAMNMENMFGQSMLILHERCFVPKLGSGLTGFSIKETEMMRIEAIERNILRNYLNLPQSSPKTALYIEFGVLPIKMDLYKRKMMMWNRLNGEESNDLMKDVVKEQVKKVLPWFRQIVKIGKDLDIDIIQGRKMEKEKWKSIVKKKIMIATEKELRDETEKLKKYKEIAKDEIEVGKQKRYMCLPVKKAASLFRARTNQLDPSPRKPYWSRKWRCRFCREKTQDTKHYILECKKAQQILGGKITKEEMWRVITTLEGEDNDLKEVAGSLQRLYKEINR